MIEKAHFIFLNIGKGKFEDNKLFVDNFNIFKNINPDIDTILWDENKINDLVKTHFKHLIKFYKELPIFYKIDFSRYLILKTHSGIYVDLDCECIKPIDKDKDYISYWGKKFNNNIISHKDIRIYDKLIEHALYRYYTCKMPLTWKFRRLEYSVGAGGMYHSLMKLEKKERTNVYDYFKDFETKSWLNVGEGVL